MAHKNILRRHGVKQIVINFSLPFALRYEFVSQIRPQTCILWTTPQSQATNRLYELYFQFIFNQFVEYVEQQFQLINTFSELPIVIVSSGVFMLFEGHKLNPFPLDNNAEEFSKKLTRIMSPNAGARPK